MTKLEISKYIASEMNLTRVLAEESVEVILDSLKEGLQNNEQITIRRFGTFSVHQKNKRIGRNPKNGVEAVISPRKVVQFKPGGYFRNYVNEAI